jgi:hypothetical protein
MVAALAEVIWINKGAPYTGIIIDKAEAAYEATYIADLALKGRDGQWNQTPVSVFYKKKPDLSKGHKHYFGLFVHDDKLMICDATSAAEYEWHGYEIGGEVIFSRWNHDWRQDSTGAMFVDGGPGPYGGRFGANGEDTPFRSVKLKIVEADFEIVEISEPMTFASMRAAQGPCTIEKEILETLEGDNSVAEQEIYESLKANHKAAVDKAILDALRKLKPDVYPTPDPVPADSGPRLG